MEARLRKGNVVSQGSDDVFEQTPLVTEGCGSASASSGVTLTSPSLVRSEKGQQARNAYRSSGYESESGDNKSGSASFHVSAEHPQHSLSDQACAAVPPASLIPDLNKEAQKCVENDFKPKNGILNSDAVNVNTIPAVQNPTKQEFETRLCTNKGRNLGHTALSLPKKEAGRINAPEQQPVCTYEPNISKEAAAIATKQTVTVSDQQDLSTSSSHAMKTSNATFQSLHCYRNFPSEKMAEHQQTNGIIPTHTRAQQKQQQQQVVNSASLADTTPKHVNPQHCVPANSMLESSQSGTDVAADNAAAKLCARTKRPFHRQDGLQDFGTISGTLESSTEDGQHISRSHDDASNVQINAQPTGHTLSCTDARFISCENDTSTSFYLTNEEEEEDMRIDMRVKILPQETKLITNVVLLERTRQIRMNQKSERASSLGCQFDEDIFTILEKCARCQEVSCDNVDCVKMRKEFSVLMDMKTELLSLSEQQMLLLQTAFRHVSSLCSHPKCPLPWCGDKMDKNLPLEEGIKLMKQRIENYAEYCRLFNSPEEEFMKLNKAFVLDSLPLEGKHWERISMLKDSRKTVLASPIRSDFPPEYKYWVIKKRLTANDSHHWDVYSRLRDVDHRSIATMLWAARFEHHLLVCHLFENLSLRDCLHGASLPQLGLTTTCQILQQMMSAVNYLHNLRIVYLYWMSKNILVTCQARESFCVKMSNFSCSVSLDNYDGDQLYLILPPSIMPPEVRAESTVELVSDVWGLGCLLYEIVTGKQVWYEHRHLCDGDLHVLLGKNPVPEIPSTYPELLSLFCTCWETDWNKRKTVRDLELLLANINL